MPYRIKDDSIRETVYVADIWLQPMPVYIVSTTQNANWFWVYDDISTGMKVVNVEWILLNL